MWFIFETLQSLPTQGEMIFYFGNALSKHDNN